MKSLNLNLFGLGFFYISLIHHVLGQRTIDTVQIGTNKYFFSDTSPYSPRLNWFLAFQYCRNIGMDLLSFQTNEEFNEIALYLENNGKSFNNYWTSGNQLGSEMWMWMTTGHPFNVTFSYWAQGGPPLTY
ncbi:C-type lectin 37Da [Armadillidium vulgare]|nr:C-type lectin 37Da [Armadillidium vulgare]